MKSHGDDLYEAQTDGVIVRVRPIYLEEQSDPDEGRWLWAYAVEIENRRPERVQLLARHWVITDASGHVEEVRGPGVVGEQPVIDPGETYGYASGCPLGTSSGTMEGTYLMSIQGGAQFNARIPAFSLETPGVRRVVN